MFCLTVDKKCEYEQPPDKVSTDIRLVVIWYALAATDMRGLSVNFRVKTYLYSIAANSERRQEWGISVASGIGMKLRATTIKKGSVCVLLHLVFNFDREKHDAQTVAHFPLYELWNYEGWHWLWQDRLSAEEAYSMDSPHTNKCLSQCSGTCCALLFMNVCTTVTSPYTPFTLLLRKCIYKPCGTWANGVVKKSQNLHNVKHLKVPSSTSVDVYVYFIIK